MKLLLYILIALTLSAQAKAKTKRAIVIGLGEQQDKSWNKINGDKDLTYVIDFLKKGGYKKIYTLSAQPTTPVGGGLSNTNQKTVAKRYMIAKKIVPLHHESEWQYKYV